VARRTSKPRRTPVGTRSPAPPRVGRRRRRHEQGDAADGKGEQAQTGAGEQVAHLDQKRLLALAKHHAVETDRGNDQAGRRLRPGSWLQEHVTLELVKVETDQSRGAWATAGRRLTRSHRPNRAVVSLNLAHLT
jgi:hypothetical protein